MPDAFFPGLGGSVGFLIAGAFLPVKRMNLSFHWISEFSNRWSSEPFCWSSKFVNHPFFGLASFCIVGVVDLFTVQASFHNATVADHFVDQAM